MNEAPGEHSHSTAEAISPGWPNLHCNLGQGALGFTLAMGSAGVVADMIAGRAPRIEAGAFSP